jgi:hypothetical protein
MARQRDGRGRFTPGWQGGPGAASHTYVKQRGALLKALQSGMPPKDITRLVRKLMTLALDGDLRAAALVLSLCPKPEPVSPGQAFPLAKVRRTPAMSIEAITESLQRLFEDYQAGRVSEAEARATRDLLVSVLEAKRLQDVEERLASLEELLSMSGGANGAAAAYPSPNV